MAAGEGSGLLIAVMRSIYRTWVLPKGEIEIGEEAQEAARREIREEIGLTGLIEGGHLGWTEHQFEKAGVRFRKRVDWFLFVAADASQLAPRLEQNVVDCGWFTPEQALKMLSHPNQRRILRRALTRLQQIPVG